MQGKGHGIWNTYNPICLLKLEALFFSIYIYIISKNIEANFQIYVIFIYYISYIYVKLYVLFKLYKSKQVHYRIKIS